MAEDPKKKPSGLPFSGDDKKKGSKPGDTPKGPPPKGWKGMAGWQQGLLALSIVLMAAGIALGFTTPEAPPAPLAGQGSTDTEIIGQGVTGLTGNMPGQPADPNPQDQQLEDGSSPWSPAMFRMGFGFFVAFAVGYAARTFFKLSIIGLGFFFLALAGLDYGGFITVEWGAFEDRYNSFADWFGGQFESIGDFVSGYLPSGAAAGIGLFTGWRRKG